ncbi:MAG: DUF4124 domain-containing protein [Candidatus Accumulibacter sp.]|jgi:hypothetical protein|nr:DUF4124 domain-containing protein [Accumulibacter sp.]
MKARISCFVFLFFAFSNGVFAEIYKCVEKGKVMYSNSHCPEGAASTVVPDTQNSGDGVDGISVADARKKNDAPPPQPEVSALPGVSKGTLELMKKQIELLIRQRELPTTVGGKEDALEGD